ncbi:invasin D [Pseudomonas migulae]|uniref:IpaD/SipD/SspD family type III secretion system needle tip protein n=1 Tax=Pseudomonas migulae TaxID=78543 RepID=UPI00209DD0B0|nr:IpaD/SipD/SspD family type III secretion system needle tip protein [Pseudomonas migulae]MCP1500727.1 invasin D [Pseudomonas migulae]
MIITNFTPKAVHSPIDLNVVTDAPLPSEMPFEAQAAFSLGQLLDRSAKELNRHLGSMLKCQPGAEKMYDALVAGGAAELLIAEFGEQVHARRIRSLMWVQQLRQSGAGMTHCRETLPMEQRQHLDVAQARILLDLQERFPPPTELAEEFKQNISSSNDFFDKLLELIDLIKNGYLAGYEHVIAAYSEFFKEFNEAITAKMKEWITGVDDGKKVDLNVGALRRELDKLIVKYSPPNPGAVLFPAPGKAGATKEEADNWRKALGLPDSCLIQNDDGTYSVVMDISPLTTMRGSLPGGNTVRWDTAKFQAWQTGFNAQEERMKNMLQSFTQKYSNANSYHDNFNKTLSAHLSQYSDMLKAMLNF